MKFTLAAMALMASTALATPSLSAEPWCERPGQSCWKAKRAAGAVLDVVGHENTARAPEAEPWCERPGQSCWKAKREAAPEADPWCNCPGTPC